MTSPRRTFSNFLTVALFTALIAPPWIAEAETDESTLLSSPRQLTFEGKRAGEGYFGRDGKYMVFQSERLAENPFYQIYDFDLTTGDIRRISPGHGKTTCAFYQHDTLNPSCPKTRTAPKARILEVFSKSAESNGRGTGSARADHRADLRFRASVPASWRAPNSYAASRW